MVGRGAVAAAALAALVTLAAPAVAAEPSSTPASPSIPSPPAVAAPEAPAEGTRAESDAAASLRATQELEVRVIELQRQLDALERQRLSFEDLRRRLDDLESRQGAAARGAPGALDDWTSFGGGRGDAIRFSQNGFVVRSPNNRFLLRPGLRLQALYAGQLAAAGVGDPARGDASAFALTHAQLLFEGHVVTQRLEFRFELDFADTAAGVVKDAFVQWRLARAVGVRVGQVKVPFGLQSQLWNGYLELVDVAAPTAAFALGRDVGLMVVGRPLGGRLQYHLAATNGPRGPCPGDAEGLPCDQVDLAYAARIVAAPFGPLPVSEGDGLGHAHPLVAVGVSGAYALAPTDERARSGAIAAPLDVDRDGRVDNVAVLQGAVELRAVFRGAALQGEWLARREHPGAGLPDRSYWGAYGQASYFVLPRRLQLVARFGRTDLPQYGASDVARLARGTHTTEGGGGVTAYLRGHDAKLQVDYTHARSPDALSAPTVDRIRAAIQLAF